METADSEIRIVAATRELLEQGGLGALRLPDLAARAGLDLAALHRLAPSPLAALRLAMRHIDGIVLADGAAEPSDPPRDRLFDVMMRRYDALVPWREALRRMARTLPPDPVLGVGLALAIERSMAAMLEAAGISSGSLAGAMRVRGLCLIHADVLRAFLDDDTPDLAPTMKALDGRLRQAERLAPWLDRLDAPFRSAAKGGPDPIRQNEPDASAPEPPVVH